MHGVGAVQQQQQQERQVLASLCSDLGPELLDVAVAPQGLDALVGGIALYDQLDPPGMGLAAGDIVIGIGLDCDGDHALALVDAAGRIGVTAIVFRRRGEISSRLISAAQDAGVALLTTDPHVPWGELHDLVQASMLADAAFDLPRSPSSMTADLVALSDATAAVAGGPITIEDLAGHLLAFSQDGQDVDSVRAETILRRRVPEERMRYLHRSGLMAQLSTSTDPVRMDWPGTQPRWVVAIRAGDHILGTIWLAAEELDPRAGDALREAAQIATLHLMRDRAFEALDKRVHGGMLRMLLRGDADPLAMLARLGFEPDHDLVVAAVQPRDLAGDGLAEDSRMVGLIVEHLRAYRWKASAAALEGRVYVLVEMHDGGDREGLRRTLADCLARASSVLGAGLRAGMGVTASGGEALATARRTADQCLELADTEDPVVPYEDVHARALLADAQSYLVAQHATVTPGLQQLLDHDRDRSTDYVASLRAYLDEFGDFAAAAARMQIHANTLRYRLKRIEELAGTNFSDADARLSLELQLRALPNGDR